MGCPSSEELTRGQEREKGLRRFGEWFFHPVLWAFSSSGISPNMITVLSMCFAMACGYFIATGHVLLGAALFVISGVLDIADGYVAKKLDRVSVFGSFLDSLLDRISDSAVYLGVAAFYLRCDEGVYVGLVLVMLVVSFLISYTRSRAETLGVTCRAGLMARAPRFIALSVGFFFNGLSPWVLRSVLWIVVALMVETFIARFVEVWKKIDK